MNISQKKISIIISIYNADKYLKKCLDSIISQNYKNFEIICINDGSQDNSLNILEDYKSRDSRIVLISQSNQGQGVARNNGILQSTGEYLVFIDPDDYIEQYYLETINSYFEKYSDDILFFNHYFEDEEQKKIKIVKPFNAKVKQEQTFSLKNFLNNKNFSLNMAAWDKVYRREYLIENSIKFGVGKIGEDQLFTIKSLLQSNKCRYLNLSFYHYVQRKNSIKRQSSKNIVLDVIANYKVVKKYLCDIGLNNSVFYKNYVLRFLGHMYLNAPAIYKPMVRRILKTEVSNKEYIKFIRQRILKNTIIKKIFSINNQYKQNIKIKKLTLFGITVNLNNKDQIT